MKTIIVLIFLLIVGILMTSAFAVGVKTPYESSSKDAASVVAYGYNGTTLVPVKVDVNGVLQTQ